MGPKTFYYKYQNLILNEFVELRFLNEKILRRQEYNFNSKLFLITNKLVCVKEFLTLKRFLSDFKQVKGRANVKHHKRIFFNTFWLNYFELKQNINLPSQFIKELKYVFPKRYYYYLTKISQKFFGKYYKFYMRLKNNEVFKTYRFSNIT